MSDQQQTRTFRGRSLAELTDRIKAELGEDAVAVSVRQGRTKGLGGFFAQETVEVEAVAAGPGPSDASPARPPEPSFYERLRQAGGVDALQQAFVAADDADAYDLLTDAGHELPAVEEPESEQAAPALEPARAPKAHAPAAVPAITMAPPALAPEAPLPELVLGGASLDLGGDDDDDEGDDELLPAIFVTAARDLPAVPQAADLARQALIERDFDEELADEIVADVIDHLLPFAPRNASMRKLVAHQIARQMTPLPRRSGRAVVGFIGSGGAGKTRSAAQLALGYAQRGARSLCVVSLRPGDEGAALRQQLASSDVEVHVARSGRMARAIVDAADEASLVIVDTPPVSPRAVAPLRRLQADLAHLELDECHLALPATVGYRHAAELVGGARALGVDAIVITHADETQYLGTAISVAIRSQLPVSYVGRAHGAARGLRPALSESLALALVA
jgi:flagellar biosynthesis protein FlhF